MAVKGEAPYPAAGLDVLRAAGYVLRQRRAGGERVTHEALVAWTPSVALRRERLDLCVLCCAPIRRGKSLCIDCRAARARASKRQSAAAHLRERRAGEARARAARAGTGALPAPGVKGGLVGP